MLRKLSEEFCRKSAEQSMTLLNVKNVMYVWKTRRCVVREIQSITVTAEKGTLYCHFTVRILNNACSLATMY